LVAGFVGAAAQLLFILPGAGLWRAEHEQSRPRSLQLDRHRARSRGSNGDPAVPQLLHEPGFRAMERLSPEIWQKDARARLRYSAQKKKKTKKKRGWKKKKKEEKRRRISRKICGE
jgi:hypothetical protein